MTNQTDNYNNPIVEIVYHDHYTAYELIHDVMGGYYINQNCNPDYNHPEDKTKNNRIIIAKFQDNNNSTFYFACLFWDNLKSKNLESIG